MYFKIIHKTRVYRLNIVNNTSLVQIWHALRIKRICNKLKQLNFSKLKP